MKERIGLSYLEFACLGRSALFVSTGEGLAAQNVFVSAKIGENRVR